LGALKLKILAGKHRTRQFRFMEMSGKGTGASIHSDTGSVQFKDGEWDRNRGLTGGLL
jgi:hypothetical protein